MKQVDRGEKSIMSMRPCMVNDLCGIGAHKYRALYSLLASSLSLFDTDRYPTLYPVEKHQLLLFKCISTVPSFSWPFQVLPIRRIGIHDYKISYYYYCTAAHWICTRASSDPLIDHGSVPLDCLALPQSMSYYARLKPTPPRIDKCSVLLLNKSRKEEKEEEGNLFSIIVLDLFSCVDIFICSLLQFVWCISALVDDNAHKDDDIIFRQRTAVFFCVYRVTLK